jgi:hypothetical protein
MKEKMKNELVGCLLLYLYYLFLTFFSLFDRFIAAIDAIMLITAPPHI